MTMQNDDPIGTEHHRSLIFKIVSFVCKKYKMSIAEITSKKGLREDTIPRYIAIYLCNEHYGSVVAQKSIGGFFNQHYTCIYHARKHVNELMDIDAAFADKIKQFHLEIKTMLGVKETSTQERLNLSYKLAEIDYMLFIIEKYEIKEAADVYMQFYPYELKNKLAARLIDFAEAETHRDYVVYDR